MVQVNQASQIDVRIVLLQKLIRVRNPVFNFLLDVAKEVHKITLNEDFWNVLQLTSQQVLSIIGKIVKEEGGIDHCKIKTVIAIFVGTLVVWTEPMVIVIFIVVKRNLIESNTVSDDDSKPNVILPRSILTFQNQLETDLWIVMKAHILIVIYPLIEALAEHEVFVKIEIRVQILLNVVLPIII